MEKQGIITGIGNEITPEIDAVINDFIVGENAIIKGLDLNRNILNAGMCQLCGYRGVLDKSQEIKDTYVYGKFVINFDKDIEDEFYIETSSTAKTTNVNPTSITSAGTYYLELYNNKKTTLPTYKYPKQAHISDKANHLLVGGTIDSTATTKTAPLNDNSQRVANTEYVHNQIVAEIDYQIESISINATNGRSKIIGALVLKNKANYIIGSFNMSETYFYGDYALSGYLGTITNAKLRPKHTAYGVFSFYGNYIHGTSQSKRYWSVRVRLETSGEVYLDETVLAGTEYDEITLNNSFTATSGLFVFGYDKGE